MSEQLMQPSDAITGFVEGGCRETIAAMPSMTGVPNCYTRYEMTPCFFT